MIIYINKKKNIGIRLPVDREKAELFLRRVIMTLAALAAILGAVCLVLALRFKWVTLHVGEELTAETFAKGKQVDFGEDFDPECVNHAGIYYFHVIIEGRERAVRLRVVDNEAPKVTVKDVKCAVGGEYPVPEDYIDTVYEPDDFTGEYVTPLPEIEKMGTYSAQVRFTDASGNKTRVFDVQVTVVVDITPPEVDLPEEVFTLLGEEPLLDVTLTDDCVGPLTYTVDYSSVDLTEEGSYEAYVIATDAVGNQSAPILFTVTVLPPAAEGEETT